MQNRELNKNYELLFTRFVNAVTTGSSTFVKNLLVRTLEDISIGRKLPKIVECANGESFYITVSLAEGIDLSSYNLVARDEETGVVISERVEGSDQTIQKVLVSDYPFPEGSIRRISIYLENPTIQGENNAVLTSLIVLGTRAIDM